MRWRPALAAVPLVLLAACGWDDSEEGFNDADVTFAQDMIPHHEQALEMARLATDRAEDEQVRDLARRIEGAQDPEIEQMRGFLDEWGEDPPSGTAGGMGMMSGDEMAQLGSAEGVAFDQLFLEQMTEHHTGAVEMARTEIEDGEDDQAIELARTIEEGQTAEVDEMEALLAQLGG
jgi:uncharacterized protein (DUF305 family)